MKGKSLTLSVLCYLIVMSSSFSFTQNQQILWEISGKGLKKPSYLFGTYHSNDKRIFEFSDSLYLAFLTSKAIVLEADLYEMYGKYNPRQQLYSMMIDHEGKTYTRKKNASSTSYGTEDGYPQFLDAYFQQIALLHNKKVIPLETIDEQSQAYLNITYNKPKPLIESMTWTKDNLLGIYLDGDLDQLEKVMKSQLSVSENAYRLLITNRNINMVHGIDSILRKQHVFIAVGAAHLPGNEGVLALLQQKGYHIRPMNASFSKEPTSDQLHFKSKKNYTLTFNELGISATFGGVPKEDTNEDHLKYIYQEMGQGNCYWLEVIPTEEELTEEKISEDYFTLPQNSKLKKVLLNDSTIAYEGLTFIYDIGDCWRRVFIHRGNVLKITCYGGNKFMNSNRPTTFFDRIKLF